MKSEKVADYSETFCMKKTNRLDDISDRHTCDPLSDCSMFAAYYRY